MKRRKVKITSLKNKLWRIFSQYIRMKYADDKGYCRCVTCNKTDLWQNLQAGHFIDGRTNAILFNEELVYPQCYRCNIVLKGNKVKFTLFMLKKYTVEQIEEFERLKNKVKQFAAYELEEMIEEYKEKLK